MKPGLRSVADYGEFLADKGRRLEAVGVEVGRGVGVGVGVEESERSVGVDSGTEVVVKL